MLDWLKKLFSVYRLKNTAGLSDEALGYLVNDFKPLDKLKLGLSMHIVRYVVDGDGPEVLGELRGLPQVHEKFELVSTGQQFHHYGGPPSARNLFFQNVSAADHALFFRLADVYQAIAGNHAIHQFHPQHVWLQVLLLEALYSTQYQYKVVPEGTRPNADDVEAMLRLRNEEPSELVHMICSADLSQSYSESYLPFIAGIRGFAQSALRHADEMKTALRQRSAKQLVHVLSLFTMNSIPTEPFLPELVALLFSTSKQVREAAAPLLYPTSATVLPLLENYLRDGKATDKILAVQWLSKIGGDNAVPLLTAYLPNEINDKVANEIKTVIGYQDSQQTVSEQRYDLPPLSVIDLKAPLSEEFHRLLLDVASRCDQEIAHLTAQRKNAEGKYIRIPDNITQHSLDTVYALLQGKGIEKESYDIYKRAIVEYSHYLHEVMKKSLIIIAGHAEMQLIHLVRLLLLFDQLSVPSQLSQTEISGGQFFRDIINSYNKSHTPRVGLRELAHALNTLNIDGSAIGWKRVENDYWIKPFHIDDDLTWPFYAEHLSQIQQVFGLEKLERIVSDYALAYLRKEAFTILRMFPFLPAKLVPFLWEVALRSSKTERPLAMACLEKVPGKGQVLSDALKDARQDARQSAAEWLGKYQLTEAIPALQAALKKEKSESVKAAMLNALQRLGVTLSEMVDRQALAKRRRMD